MSYEKLRDEYPNLEEATLKVLFEAHPLLQLEYNALCRTLVEQHSTNSKTRDQNNWQGQIKKALDLNQALQRLCKHTGASKKAKRDLEIQHQALTQLCDAESPHHTPLTPRSPPASETLRLESGRRNPLRLFLPRSRRLLLIIQTFLETLSEQHAQRLKKGFQPVDVVIAPVINILSWLFLLPRMLTNLFLFGKHVISPTASEHEEQLTWTQRFKAQFRERWFELANDLIWVPGGFLTCFLLLGPLAIIGAYLTVAMFAWDVVICSARAVHELTRLSALIRQHQTTLTTLTQPSEAYSTQQTLIHQLEQHLAFEKKRHAVSVGNSVLVLIFTFFALSIVVLPILVPLIAACLLVSVTIAQFLLNFYYLPSIQPGNPIASLVEAPTPPTASLGGAPTPIPFPSPPHTLEHPYAKRPTPVQDRPHPISGATTGTPSSTA